MSAISVGAYRRVQGQLKHARELNTELVAALKHAVECAEYCRRAHPDVQRGEGVPAEAFWKELIDRAER